jgi:hypothetical protein
LESYVIEIDTLLSGKNKKSIKFNKFLHFR